MFSVRVSYLSGNKPNLALLFNFQTLTVRPCVPNLQSNFWVGIWVGTSILQKNKNSVLTRFIPYVRNIQNILCFEFCENTKGGIFCLSQGLDWPWYPQNCCSHWKWLKMTQNIYLSTFTQFKSKNLIHSA